MHKLEKIHELMEVSEKVKTALSEGKAIVALESTIIAHGMPYPENVKTALELEAIVEAEGAVPATIAVIEGKIKVGLDQHDLEILGNHKNTWKVSVADLPYVLVNKLHGATTVAATMRIADIAGIRFFVTGGIGGVHREFSKCMDVSADLREMSLTNVAIISAGVKSILDIGLTLEALETLCIPVLTIGQDEFPSFYSRKSGFRSPLRMDDENDIARMIKTKWDLGINGSVLVANPVPSKDEIAFDLIEIHIKDALNAATHEGITGKKITPYLLDKINRKSKGKSLTTNIALVKNNASTGARIAVKFNSL